MRALILLFRHPATVGSVLLSFITWYFLEEPARIVRRTEEYLSAFTEIFSFGFLIRTLFSPWKMICEEYPKYGLDISSIAQAFVLNLTSRIIGFLFRIVPLLFGVLFILVFFLCSLLFLVLWVMTPALLYALSRFLF